MADEKGAPWGLIAIAFMALLSIAAAGASVYRARNTTRSVGRAWAVSDTLFASIQRTAPWSEPWTSLCRLEPASHTELWCRSLSALGSVELVDDAGGVTVVVLQNDVATGLWLLDAMEGSTVFGPDLSSGYPNGGTPRWVRVGDRLVVAWPSMVSRDDGTPVAPQRLRAIDLHAGTTDWAFPLEDEIDGDTLSILDGRLTLRGGTALLRIDPATGAMHAD